MGGIGKIGLSQNEAYGFGEHFQNMGIKLTCLTVLKFKGDFFRVDQKDGVDGTVGKNMVIQCVLYQR